MKRTEVGRMESIWLLGLLLLVLLATPSTGFQCYECTSVGNAHCEDSEMIKKVNNFCTIDDGLCVKYIQRSNFSEFVEGKEIFSKMRVYRGCAKTAEDIPKEDHHVKRVTSSESQIDYFFCTSDKCNSAPLGQASFLIISITFLVTFLWSF
ncbi:hypothetical protein Ciccas_010627 [Cichlidogyrus casuarinus]|uniref:Protein quiver n=1 Tax=Cichlidogyrus casuarinus TaxID=1844966 RepID=A0ABD2PTL5_9PLAT